MTMVRMHCEPKTQRYRCQLRRTSGATPSTDPLTHLARVCRYTGALNNGTGTYPGYIDAEMVFDMRLQQAAGANAPSVQNGSYVTTYDLSCPTSPYGSVCIASSMHQWHWCDVCRSVPALAVTRKKNNR